MKIQCLTIGTRMPNWVETGYQEYAQRLPPECRLELTELPLATRPKNPSAKDIDRIKQQEGEKLLGRIPKGNAVIALDERGKPWSTLQLAEQLKHWLQDGRDISLLVGGPDGLSRACKQRAAQTWSLSALTLPHPLVRVVLAEQIYRAWSVINNHPYHRA